MTLRRALAFLSQGLVAGVTLAGMATLGGCAADMGATEKTDTTLEAELSGDAGEIPSDDAADSYTRRLVPMGPIAYGDTVEATFPASGYLGWTFTARAGAMLSLDTVGVGRTDTVLLVYGPQTGADFARARAIAVNDDYRGSLDSHIDLRVQRSGTYLVVVRSFGNRGGSFELTLGCNGSQCRVECGADDSCPTGSSCARVYCVRAPCPSYCEPPAAGAEGQSCGGRGQQTCPDGYFCAYAPEAICGRADASGSCARRPQACITLYNPVCGCDGETYSNSCAAANAGMSVDYTGECAPREI